ncbi:MAG: ABC transporter ATP-binding protein [Eubacteriales bacterium]
MTIQDKKYTLTDFIKIPFASSPVLTVIRIIDKIIYALVPSLTVLVSADFINTALAIFNGEKQRADIYLPLFFFLLIIVHQYIDWTLMSFVTSKMSMKLGEGFRAAVVDKRARLEYRHIENNDTWELINRACGDPAGRIFGGFDILLRMADMVVRVVSLLAILFAQVWWAGLVIILFSVPLFRIAIKSGKTNYEAFKEAAKYSRKADYLRGVLTGRENVEERSVFGYTDDLNEKWYEKFETARKINLRVQGKNFIRMKGASLITICISLLITGVLTAPLGRGELSIGMFIGLVGATFSLVQMVSWELAYITSEIANNKEYLKDLSAFSALSEQSGALDLPEKGGMDFERLEFRGVSFKYPGTEKYILRDCSFVMEKDNHYAFVGVNGAGKTTITKLLTGLYPEYEGDILINGLSLRDYSFAQLKAMFSVVYQDFAKYYISMRDNITLGDIHGVSDESIAQSTALIGLDEAIGKLKDGINTSLGKIKEDGVDLSGGEWQRVAIARALVSSAPIRILDEPTAALDPVAESGIYELFGKISGEKTTIFITHRLGAARLADIIFVIDEGRVAERGTHVELVEKGGLYSEMYEAQRSWYK